jgi:hypothetical protein
MSGDTVQAKRQRFVAVTASRADVLPGDRGTVLQYAVRLRSGPREFRACNARVCFRHIWSASKIGAKRKDRSEEMSTTLTVDLLNSVDGWTGSDNARDLRLSTSRPSGHWRCTDVPCAEARGFCRLRSRRALAATNWTVAVGDQV